MAKKYKKMNYAKTLSRTGSTFAVAMAVTVALANQAQASELPVSSEEELPVTPVEDIAVTGASSSIAVDPSEVSEVNAEVSQSNTETAEENAATAENNEIIDDYNEEAIGNNNTDTEGQLPVATLPELPEAPEAPEIPNTGALENEAHNEAVDGYNEKVDGYNEKVDGYNEAVDGYNNVVDGYNDAADIRDSEVQDQYQKELDEYNKYLDEQQAHDDAYQAYLEEIARLEAEHNAAQDKAEADHEAAQNQAEADHEAARAEAEAAHNAAEEKAKAEHEAAEKAAYEAAKAEAEAAHKAAEEQAKADHDAAELKAYEDAKAKADADHNAAQDKAEADHEAAQDKAEADHEAAQDKLEADHNAAKAEAEAAYEEDKKTYEDAVATEEKIYDDVTEYNNGILEDNADINDLNDALEDALDSKAVDNIDEVSDLNANVEVDADILETLNTHDELAAAQQALLDRGAALDADPRKDAELGSDDYASYLEDVKQFNADVEAHNANVTAYNEAVTAYNEAVDIYNQNAETTTSTGSTATGVADWGNIEISSNTTFGHIDVKYTAATAKDKTVEVDEDGNETISYSDSVTSHTVVGVYTSEEAANKNPNSYGVTYTNNNNSTSKTQGLQKESSEFRTTSHNSASLDPEEGQINFYMTLQNNETGEIQSINVNLDDTTVYPEGTYYNGKNMNNLGYFRDSNGNSLPQVTINGTTYYDISGQSVFVVSAMTCDGMRIQGLGNWFGPTVYTMDPDGLDLVLNVQTLIEISQANKANKINYASYELGKTAQAEKVEHKTYEEINGEFEYPEFQRTKYERTKYERTEYEREDFEYPEFEGTEYEGKDFVYPDFEPTEYEGNDFVYPDFEPTEFQREDFTAPEYDGPGIPDEVTPPDEVPLETQRLERAEKLNKLDKLLHTSWTPSTPDPDPTPDPIEPEPMVIDAEEPIVTIIDEPVPLAKAPKTGDLSGLWALLSGMSLGGMGLLNRKRKEEE